MLNIAEVDFYVVLDCGCDSDVCIETLKNLSFVNKNFRDILMDPFFWKCLTQKLDKIGDNIVCSLSDYEKFLRVIEYMKTITEDDDSSDTVSFVVDADEVKNYLDLYSKKCEIYIKDNKITSKTFEFVIEDYEYLEYNDLAEEELDYCFAIHYQERLDYYYISFIIKDLHYNIYGLTETEAISVFYHLTQANTVKDWCWC